MFIKMFLVFCFCHVQTKMDKNELANTYMNCQIFFVLETDIDLLIVTYSGFRPKYNLLKQTKHINIHFNRIHFMQKKRTRKNMFYQLCFPILLHT